MMNIQVETLLQIIGRLTVEKEILVKKLDEITRRTTENTKEAKNETD